MNRTAVGLILSAALVLAACVGPLVPVTRVDDATAVELTGTIAVYPANETPTNAIILGPITATSCKNKLWDKDATNDDATNQLRLLARQRGGNAVGNLVCEQSQGTSLATNCWASVTCTGTAIKISSETPRKRR